MTSFMDYHLSKDSVLYFNSLRFLFGYSDYIVLAVPFVTRDQGLIKGLAGLGLYVLMVLEHNHLSSIESGSGLKDPTMLNGPYCLSGP